jgi:hypothetical protein
MAHGLVAAMRLLDVLQLGLHASELFGLRLELPLPPFQHFVLLFQLLSQCGELPSRIK